MVALVAGVLLALVHLVVVRSPLFERRADIWKSVAGGIGIAYAFLVLFPKLAAAQRTLQAATDGGFYGYLEHHSYLVALVGLVTYYGLSIAVDRFETDPPPARWQAAARLLTVCHASAMAGYYFLVGYLVGETKGWREAGAILGPMSIHYLAIDHGLLHRYGDLYRRRLRWLFFVATLGGDVLAVVTEIRYTTLALLNSLFAGVLIVATLQEKLPSSRHARFRPFLAGVVGFSLLLLALE